MLRRLVKIFVQDKAWSLSYALHPHLIGSEGRLVKIFSSGKV